MLSPVGKMTTNRLSLYHAPTASPWSKISTCSFPSNPSAVRRLLLMDSTIGRAALNIWRMPPGLHMATSYSAAHAESSEASQRSGCVQTVVRDDNVWTRL